MPDASPANAQPRFSLTLTPTANVCHLTGSPRFGFKLKITSYSDQVITVCLSKTPLKELHSLDEIAYITDSSGSEAEMPFAIGCWEHDDPFPSDFCFEEFRPGEPYERMFWLDKEDPKTSQGGELECLRAGTEYKVRVSGELLDSFNKWRRGTKEELLVGGLEEKKERWKAASGKIDLDVSEPFMFRAE